MAKIRSKFIKVLVESIVTKHQVILIRLRTIDPIEVLRYDPKLQAPCIYREVEKIGSHKRKRLGLTPAPSASGPLTEDPDWSYPDGTPGPMNKGQTDRYLRDQEFGETMVKFGEQFKAIEEMRKKKNSQLKGIEPN